MSMIYNAEKGWIEVHDPIILKENFIDDSQQQTEKNIKELQSHLKNLQGYSDFLIQQYRENPNDYGNVNILSEFTQFLRKNIGPGAIGEWSR